MEISGPGQSHIGHQPAIPPQRRVKTLAERALPRMGEPLGVPIDVGIVAPSIATQPSSISQRKPGSLWSPLSPMGPASPPTSPQSIAPVFHAYHSPTIDDITRRSNPTSPLKVVRPPSPMKLVGPTSPLKSGPVSPQKPLISPPLEQKHRSPLQFGPGSPKKPLLSPSFEKTHAWPVPNSLGKSSPTHQPKSVIGKPVEAPLKIPKQDPVNMSPSKTNNNTNGSPSKANSTGKSGSSSYQSSGDRSGQPGKSNPMNTTAKSTASKSTEEGGKVEYKPRGRKPKAVTSPERKHSKVTSPERKTSKVTSPDRKPKGTSKKTGESSKSDPWLDEKDEAETRRKPRRNAAAVCNILNAVTEDSDTDSFSEFDRPIHPSTPPPPRRHKSPKQIVDLSRLTDQNEDSLDSYELIIETETEKLKPGQKRKSTDKEEEAEVSYNDLDMLVQSSPKKQKLSPKKKASRSATKDNPKEKVPEKISEKTPEQNKKPEKEETVVSETPEKDIISTDLETESSSRPRPKTPVQEKSIIDPSPSKDPLDIDIPPAPPMEVFSLSAYLPKAMKSKALAKPPAKFPGFGRQGTTTSPQQDEDQEKKLGKRKIVDDVYSPQSQKSPSFGMSPPSTLSPQVVTPPPSIEQTSPQNLDLLTPPPTTGSEVEKSESRGLESSSASTSAENTQRKKKKRRSEVEDMLDAAFSMHEVRKAEKDFAQQQQLIAEGAAEPDSSSSKNKRRSLFESFHYDVPKKDESPKEGKKKK